MSAPRTALDLTETHFMRQCGDITVIGTWFGTDQRRPCLAIVPSRVPMSHERITPAIVPLDTAYLWSEEMGDPQHCAHACARFASGLGLDVHNKFAMINLMSAIRDHLGDLISMPVAPTDKHAVMADAIYTDANGREHHKEITDRA
jgi:hypothetical protein